MIRTVALTKRFSSTVALTGVDLQVARGECLELRGANGGGRSTLLKILATLVRPSSGTLEIDGVDCVRRPYDARGRIAYVGERSLSGDGLRVREYLSFFSGARPPAPKATMVTIDEIIARANVPPDASVDDLSSGLRQRLSLATALLVQPQVLLLDDPFRALDSSGRSLFVEWIREIRDRGTTIVVASNDDHDVAALSHRVARIDAGRVVSNSSLRHADARVEMSSFAAAGPSCAPL